MDILYGSGVFLEYVYIYLVTAWTKHSRNG